jgi:hypothetical protein
MVICPVKDYAALFCLQYTLTENSWFHVCSIVVYNSGGASLKTQDGLTIFFATQHINYQLTVKIQDIIIYFLFILDIHCLMVIK